MFWKAREKRNWIHAVVACEWGEGRDRGKKVPPASHRERASYRQKWDGSCAQVFCNSTWFTLSLSGKKVSIYNGKGEEQLDDEGDCTFKVRGLLLSITADGRNRGWNTLVAKFIRSGSIIYPIKYLFISERMNCNRYQWQWALSNAIN